MVTVSPSRALLWLTAAIWWGGNCASPAEEPAPPPVLVAEAAIAIDPATGFILYEKNAHSLRAVASTQKLLTALLVVERGGLDETVKVESSDTKVAPTRVGIRSGNAYTRRQLLTALLVKSGNDVAKCLARDHSGSQEGFAEALNARAHGLGMRQSHFLNPHGLTEEGQYSTARDMAKLAMVAYRSPEIREIVCTKEIEFEHPGGWRPTFKNSNRLLHQLTFVNGMKTGTTDAAGRCLVSSGSHEGRDAIAVILGSTNEAVWEDSEKILRWALGIPEERPANNAKG